MTAPKVPVLVPPVLVKATIDNGLMGLLLTSSKVALIVTEFPEVTVGLEVVNEDCDELN
jgi:hypothetical protein